MPGEISMRLVEELLPYAKNSRNHSDGQVETLAKNIKRFGWTNPVLVADSGIIAGHGRILAAKKLGLVRVPCIDLSHLSADDRRALVISDNRIAEMATWSLEDLKVETDYLREVGFDLEADLGFAEDDLAGLLAGLTLPEEDNPVDPDAVPDVPKVPVSVHGDVWCIGEHRVMCGSSLDAADWDRLMAGEQAQVVWTDPPYNVDIGGKNDSMAKARGGKNKTGAILNDKMGDTAFYDFLLGMFRCVIDVMEPGAPIYVFHADSEGINFRTAFRDAGFKAQGAIVWNKNSLVLGRFDHQQRTEPCLYGWRPGAAHKWYGGRKVTNVLDLGDDNPFVQREDGRWAFKVGDQVLVVDGEVSIEVLATDMIHVPKPAKSELHPTMKPTELVRRQLANSSRRGDVVADAFGGSGSTGVAAHQLHLKSRLMELDPKYVDVICLRMAAFTGLPVTHFVTGEAFPVNGEARVPVPESELSALPLDESIF